LREHAAVLAQQYREPFADAVRRGIESGAFTPRFDTAAVVEVVVASIVGLLYPVVLGHPTAQGTDYRDVVLAQLAFALTAGAQDASGSRPALTRPVAAGDD
jgi:hypothetical protein